MASTRKAELWARLPAVPAWINANLFDQTINTRIWPNINDRSIINGELYATTEVVLADVDENPIPEPVPDCLNDEDRHWADRLEAVDGDVHFFTSKPFRTSWPQQGQTSLPFWALIAILRVGSAIPAVFAASLTVAPTDTSAIACRVLLRAIFSS
jgi:hypothetical protein